MRLCALAPSLRRAIVPLVSLIILTSLGGCGGSGAGSAPQVGGAKVDPDVEAENRKAMDTYAKEKGGQGR
jgi:hypothetical protein